MRAREKSHNLRAITCLIRVILTLFSERSPPTATGAAAAAGGSVAFLAGAAGDGAAATGVEGGAEVFDAAGVGAAEGAF
jgi:hypothetical protein